MSDEQMKKYQEGMNKGLRDKLFFVDHIDNWQLLVDFGTARGDLIKAVLPYEPNAHYIGYDISPEMISQAISNVGEEENIQFTDKWPEVAQAVQITQGTSILVLNSVLHEVFSYSSPKEYSKFWGQALKSGFSYISLRDMMPNQKDMKTPLSEEDQKCLETLRGISEEKVSSFEEAQGVIEYGGQLVHLLLKWDYDENWEREVHENYFGITKEDMFKKINSKGLKGYKVDYWDNFTLPFLKKKWKKDFDYDCPYKTHVKVLFKS